MRHFIFLIAALGLIVLSTCPHAATSGETDGVNRPADARQSETLDAERGSPRFERNDCVVKDAICRSECSARRACVADHCEAQAARCLGSLPTGKTPSLPLVCILEDQEAVRRMERQGEVLDMDPTLFADSYHALIRARIACQAGLFPEALNFYDEIRESLREKPVLDNRATESGLTHRTD
jgi:hypothetical protein